jgi:transposase
MAYNFIECNREQEYLLPVSLKEWLSEGDLAWFIIDAVEHVDLRGIYNKYRVDGKGQAAYEPSMMVSMLIYAYCMGERSSRKIERLCERDIAFKTIAANKIPDHSSISRFRKENGERLGGLFKDVLKLCGEAGLVKVGIVALDGVKIKAEAALESNRSYAHIEKEVSKMLSEAEAVDAKEDELYGRDKRGDELPEGLRGRKNRLKRLKECKDRLEKEAKEEALKQKEKTEARESAEAETGKKKRGRKPKEAVFEPQVDAKANITDPESRRHYDSLRIYTGI